jgi:hypothetical protein
MTVLSEAGSLPTQVQQAAIEQRLGSYQRYFARHKRIRQLTGGVLLLLMAGGGLAAALLAHSGAKEADKGFFTVIVGVFGSLVLLMLIVVVNIGRQSPVFSARARAGVYHLFEHGFVQVTGAGPQVYRWDEVLTSSVQSVKVGLEHVQNYRLAFRDGRQVRLRNVSTDMFTFGPLIQEAVACAQLPKVTAHVRGGQPASFGTFTVTHNGITVGRKDELPWREVSGIEVLNGFVFVKRGGQKHAAVAAEEVPNLWTFVTLAQQLAATDGRL